MPLLRLKKGHGNIYQSQVLHCSACTKPNAGRSHIMQTSESLPVSPESNLWWKVKKLLTIRVSHDKLPSHGRCDIKRKFRTVKAAVSRDHQTGSRWHSSCLTRRQTVSPYALRKGHVGFRSLWWHFCLHCGNWELTVTLFSSSLPNFMLATLSTRQLFYQSLLLKFCPTLGILERNTYLYWRLTALLFM